MPFTLRYGPSYKCVAFLLKAKPSFSSNVPSGEACHLFSKCLARFLAALGLCCYTRLSLVAASGGCSLVTVHRLPVIMASLLAENSL